MSEAEVTDLEQLMDECQKDLEPLKSFVLPGGGRVQGFRRHTQDRPPSGLGRVRAATAVKQC